MPATQTASYEEYKAREAAEQAAKEARRVALHEEWLTKEAAKAARAAKKAAKMAPILAQQRANFAAGMADQATRERLAANMARVADLASKTPAAETISKHSDDEDDWTFDVRRAVARGG